MMIIFFAALILTQQNFFASANKADEDFLLGRPGYQFEDPNVLEVTAEPMDLDKCPRSDELQIKLYDHLCFKSDVAFVITAYKDDQFQISLPYADGEDEARKVLSAWSAENPVCRIKITKVQGIHEELLPEGCQERRENHIEVSFERRNLGMGMDGYPTQFSHKDVIGFPPRDQGNCGSCVGQSVASTLDYHFSKCAGQAVQTSAAWIYMYSGDRSWARGTYYNKLIKGVQSGGVAMENEVPYGPACSEKQSFGNVDQSIKNDAKTRKVSSDVHYYNHMRDRDLETRKRKIKQLIMERGPGMTTFRTGFKKNPWATACYDYGTGLTGHAVTCTGWTEEGVEYRDSRGDQYCNGGYGIFRWNDLNKLGEGLTFLKIDCPVDPCVNNPCQNGASCINNGGIAKCDCTAGYVGDMCQMPPGSLQCRMTMDNYVTSIMFNGQNLDVKGDKNDWNSVKTFWYTPAPGGAFEICGYADENTDCGCSCSGMILECDNGIVSSTQWQAAGSSSMMSSAMIQSGAVSMGGVCISSSRFSLPGQQNGAAQKIWPSNGRKYACFTLTPQPAEPGTQPNQPPPSVPVTPVTFVECRMTMDNYVTSVKFNGQNLNVAGDLNNWASAKIFTYSPTPGGTFEICGYEDSSNNCGCSCSGFLLECDNGIVSNTQWTAAGQNSPISSAMIQSRSVAFGGVCITSSAFSLSGQKNNAAQKIWPSNGNKYACFTLTPEPALSTQPPPQPTQPLPQPTEPLPVNTQPPPQPTQPIPQPTQPLPQPTQPTPANPVQCRMTMDNFVTSVAFNGQNLNVAGDLNDWQSAKTFTYTPVPGGAFEICGYEQSSNNCGCSCSGLFLECDNGVVSNTQWKAVGQNSPISSSMIKSGSVNFGGVCITSSAFYLSGAKNNGAQKIWPSNGNKYACFTLTPEPAPVTLDCNGTPNGNAKLDACGVCGGDGSSCRDTSVCDAKSKDIPHCGRCLYNQQCEEGTFCCPLQKKCVKTEAGCGDKCDSNGESAKCSPGCKETAAGFPYSCTCSNSDFPLNWVPGCPSDPCDPNPCQSGESCSYDELGGPKCIPDDTCTQTEAAFCKLTPCSIMCKPSQECPCSCPSDPPTKSPTHLVSQECATPDPDYCALADCHHLCPASLHCPCKCGAEPDCAGTPGGSAQKDVCGVCNGDGSTCLDCAGTPNGNAQIDACGVCDGDGSSCADCAGTPNGNAKNDACGVCQGDGSSCADCAGTPNGSAVEDACGVCGGDSSTCMDCAGVPNGDAEEDECGVCGGDGSTCTVCDADYALVEENKQQFLDECSEEYPAEAVDCYAGSIVIKWGGDPEKIKETKQKIKQADGVKTKSFGPFKLKPKKPVCAPGLLDQAKAAFAAVATEECKIVIESQKLDGLCPCVNSVDTSSIPWDDFDCRIKENKKKTIKERAFDCECPQRQCRMLCPNGFKKNERGCDTCKCAEGSESNSSSLMTLQQALTYSDHPVTKAFALVGLIVVFYSMFKCVAQKSGFHIRRNWSYSSVIPEEDEI